MEEKEKKTKSSAAKTAKRTLATDSEQSAQTKKQTKTSKLIQSEKVTKQNTSKMIQKEPVKAVQTKESAPLKAAPKKVPVKLIAIIVSAVVLCASIITAVLLTQKVDVYLHVGSSTTVYSINKGSVFNKPTDVEILESEEIVGWFTEPEFINEYDFTQAVDEDLHLYLSTAIRHISISYDANLPEGTTCSNFNFSITDTVEYGQTYTLPAEEPMLDGDAKYYFEGWNVEPIMDIFFPGDSISVEIETNHLFIIASWVPQTQIVHFDPNGADGFIDDAEKIPGETFDLPDPTLLNKPGYSLVGWTLNADNENTNVLTEEELKLEDLADANEITLYAKWEITTYTLTFSGKYDSINGESAEANSYSIKYTMFEPITLPTATRGEYYEFIGWTVSVGDGSWAQGLYFNQNRLAFDAGQYGNATLSLKTQGVEMRLIFSAPAGQKELINAEYPNLVEPATADDYVYVRYNGSVSTAYKKSNSSFQFLSMPRVDYMEKNGSGWRAQANNKSSTNIKLTTTLNSDNKFYDLKFDDTLKMYTFTIYASFEQKTFILNNAEDPDGNETTTIKAEYGLTITLPSATSKYGKTFVGWVVIESLESGNLQIYASGQEITINDTVTTRLQAYWLEDL